MTPRFARVPAHLAGAQDLSARDWRVYVCIALHADIAGRSHPSLNLIASLTGIDRRHVSLSVRRLENGGHLRHWPHKGASGAWTNSIYEVIFKDPGGASGAAQEGPPEADEQTIKRPTEDRAIADSMLAIWREECGDALSIPRSLDRDRVTACQARFGDSFARDLEQWRSLCREIRQSPFCCGQGSSGWRANFDWALKPKSIRNVLEGRYRDDRPPRSRGNGTYDGIPPLGPGGT